ncbi:MAG: exodeoxyribonuclease VII small subunit [Myxococcaceae bacterium]|nr:exodeoxyribonuclease VII small subunit [Myxococcaceae bacterium]
MEGSDEVAKTQTAGGKGQYDDVVKRLELIVEALEGGSLALEDSLERFAEGITLVKKGEALLSEAEKRIEQLLSEDGRTAPVEVREPVGQVAPQAPVAARPPPPRRAPAQGAEADDDVPF